MSSVSDYTSILEIGFGLNAAASYVGAFINPALKISREEIDRFRWWIDNPDRARSLLSEGKSMEDCEDRLVSWEHAYDNLARKVKQLSQIPIGFSIAAALGCVFVLMLPEMSVTDFGLLALMTLVVGPSLGGAAYTWFASREVQQKERLQAKRANDLFS